MDFELGDVKKDTGAEGGSFNSTNFYTEVYRAPNQGRPNLAAISWIHLLHVEV